MPEQIELSVLRENTVGVAPFLWTGTPRQLRSPPLIRDGATAQTTAKVVLKWNIPNSHNQAVPNGAVVTSRSPISTSCAAPTAWSCVSQAVLSNSQVIVRGINATKVLDVNKQVKKGFFNLALKLILFYPITFAFNKLTLSFSNFCTHHISPPFTPNALFLSLSLPSYVRASR